MRALYDGEIRFVDEQIRRLADFLEAAGVLENTVIILTSDHGDEFMDHGGLGHGMTLELEMIHVPMIVHGVPDAMRRRVPAVVRNIDIGPTILDLAEVEVPANLDGRSLLPLIRAEDGERPEFSFSWIDNENGFFRAVTSDRWHFIWEIASESGV